MKGNKGITLIALVITIIVLLILAGVSIAMLSGDNSILKNAQSARDNSAKGTLDEAVKIAIGNIMTDNLGWPNGKTAADLKTEIEKVTSLTVTPAEPASGKKVATFKATPEHGEEQTVYVNLETGAVVDAAD